MSELHSRTWHWPFNEPAASIWPIFADTVRFNEAAGFPAHQIREERAPDGSTRYFGEAKIDDHLLAWEEIPTNWVENQWFVHERRFSKGPFGIVRAEVRLDTTATGCICHYTLSVLPAGLAGQLVLLAGFFKKTERRFTRMAAQARAYLARQQETPFESGPASLVPGAGARCEQLRQGMATSPYHHGLLPALTRWVLERPESDVWTLRPKALARHWQVPAKQAIEACLLAASHGLLSLRWDLLCPNCRIGKAPSLSMDEIPTGAHCSTCNIDYQRDFNRNVELTFQPSKSLRQLQSGEYCLFGPMSTPHIVVQMRVDAGTTRTEPLALPPSHYRIRTLEPGNAVDLDLREPCGACLSFSFDGELRLERQQPHGLEVTNTSGRARVLIIEQREWMQDVLTAQEAATMQCFRELFDAQILRPGDHVEIDNVTLMFTDIKASTALYERIGDAAAFALVREHFAILANCVRHHDGAIVKTIGDAIMAAFNVPLDALTCAIAIQQAFAYFNASRQDAAEQVVVKLGLHGGPCIAVTLNGILDYYGRVANQTARIQGLSEGGDIILSQRLADEPTVQALLARQPLQQGSSTLKGIAGDTPWVRLTPAVIAALTRSHAPFAPADD